MAIATGKKTGITIDNILDYISEEEIIRHYLEIGELPYMMCSPLRPDGNPSFRIDLNELGKLRFHDFGTDDDGGCFDLLMQLFQLGFYETLEKVHSDIIEKIPSDKLIKRNQIHHTRIYAPKITNLNVKIRPLRTYDIEFWESFGISAEWLKFGNIHPISHVFIEKDGKKMVIPAEKHAYVFVEYKDGVPTFKIYQPYSENHKWINKHNKSVWDLWSKLPESGETLIITSSRKDALCIWANLGIPATSLQAESFEPKDNVVEQLKSRFKDIYILYDNDFNNSIENVGRVNGEKLAKMFGFKQMEIDEKYRCKDPSDLYKKFGNATFIEIMVGMLGTAKN